MNALRQVSLFPIALILSRSDFSIDLTIIYPVFVTFFCFLVQQQLLLYYKTKLFALRFQQIFKMGKRIADLE